VDLASLVRKQGFAILTEVWLPTEAERLVADLQTPSLRRSKAGIRHALKHPAVAALAVEPRLMEIARQVLGIDATPFRATLFDKSPQSNWLVVWHQDTALPLRERRDIPGWGPWSIKDEVTYAHAPASALCRVAALRLHLDDSTPRNGPLRVLPGTHANGVLSDDAIQELALRIAPVDCLVSRGGVLVMRPLTIHASSKSTFQMPRRVLHIEYAESAAIEAGLDLAVA
jgi:ectoine hydroxylase-related dioxygenase (phytanoyl-CoA dioxygenase family)